MFFLRPGEGGCHDLHPWNTWASLEIIPQTPGLVFSAPRTRFLVYSDFCSPQAAQRTMGGLEECPDKSIDVFTSDNYTVKTVKHDLMFVSSITLYRKWFTVPSGAGANYHFGLGFQSCLPLI